MKIKNLYPIVDEPVERKSSVFQYRDLFSIMKNGEWCPIVFNVVDGVECGHIKYHKMALRIAPGLDYTFPVGNCRYTKNKYILTSKDKTELKKLPAYYGNGLYEAHVRQNVFVNIGDKALGFQEKKNLRIGLDYVISKTTIKAVE